MPLLQAWHNIVMKPQACREALMTTNHKKNHNGVVQAHIRVGDRGGAYIPSEEIASLPEVKIMQARAAAIVGRSSNNFSTQAVGLNAARREIKALQEPGFNDRKNKDKAE